MLGLLYRFILTLAMLMMGNQPGYGHGGGCGHSGGHCGTMGGHFSGSHMNMSHFSRAGHGFSSFQAGSFSHSGAFHSFACSSHIFRSTDATSFPSSGALPLLTGAGHRPIVIPAEVQRVHGFGHSLAKLFGLAGSSKQRRPCFFQSWQPYFANYCASDLSSLWLFSPSDMALFFPYMDPYCYWSFCPSFIFPYTTSFAIGNAIDPDFIQMEGNTVDRASLNDSWLSPPQSGIKNPQLVPFEISKP